MTETEYRADAVVCGTCFHSCALKEGQYGLCRARKNEGGSVIAANYGLITALALDPIEKKPLARFHPGSMILSVGSFGCNLRCPYCQNHDIAQCGGGKVSAQRMTPEALADMAVKLVPQGNIGLAFTYNEPMVGWEFVRDTALEVRERGLLNVLVTNGCASPEAHAAVLPYIDAYNIDLKRFTKEGYAALGGDLDMVLSFLRNAAERAHVELTTLIVPGCNDTEAEMREEAAWIASVDPSIPLHITRYFPRWKTKTPPTDIAVMRRLKVIAERSLKTVLLGNI